MPAVVLAKVSLEVLVHCLRKTEIQDFDGTVVANLDVSRLQISMNDTGVVEIWKRTTLGGTTAGVK